MLLHLLTTGYGTFRPSTDVCSTTVFGGDPDISQRPSRGPSFDPLRTSAAERRVSRRTPNWRIGRAGNSAGPNIREQAAVLKKEASHQADAGGTGRWAGIPAGALYASCLRRIGDSITRAPWLNVMYIPGQRSQAAR